MSIVGPIKSKLFEEDPPDVSPSVIKVKVPCSGRNNQDFKIKIRNTSAERLTFKIRGTKQDQFVINPTKGFVEPTSTFIINGKPKRIKSGEDFNQSDHFAIVVAPAPKGDEWEAKSIWKPGSKMEPKQIQRFQVRIKIEETEDEEQEEEEEEEVSSSSSSDKTSNESSAQSSSKSRVKPSAKPPAKQSKNIVKSSVKLPAKPSANVPAKHLVKPLTQQPLTKPSANPLAKPLPKPLAKPLPKPLAKPSAQPLKKPSVIPPTKPLPKPLAKPPQRNSSTRPR